MIGEFTATQELHVWPMACIVCGAQDRPQADTGVEKYVGSNPGRIYLCRLCTEKSARVLGMVEGDEMAKLKDASTLLAEREMALRKREETIKKLTLACEDAGKQIAALAEERDYLEGRVKQLTAAIKEQAQADLSLVGE